MTRPNKLTREERRLDRELMKKILHLTPRVGQRNKIEIIGIPHGSYLKPLSRPTKRYLTSFLTEYKGRVYREQGAAKSFAPKSLLDKPEEIEPPDVDRIIDELSEGKWKTSEKRAIIMHGIGNLMRLPIAHFTEGRSVAYTPLGKKYARAARRNLEIELAKELRVHTGEAAGFIITVRSLVMAGELLRRNRVHRSPVALIVGTGHASQIHAFIENPTLALRFISMHQPALIRANVNNLPLLRRAAVEFALLKSEQSTLERKD